MAVSTGVLQDLATWRWGKLPAWPIAVFIAAVGVAYSPSVLTVFQILADFDALALKEHHLFFHNEAVHLVTIARPVAALLSNLPVVPVQSAGDFRWVHLFSMLTVCFLGWRLIENCMTRLRVGALDAMAVALAVFMGLAIVYAVLESVAWAPHLFTALLAFWAYSVLGRSNPLTVTFLGHLARRDYRGLVDQVLAYCRSRPVWGACLIYQVAFYTYPPYALLVVVLPVTAVLLSRAPAAYRDLIAVRDVIFIAGNVVIYSLSTMLLYLPIVRMFTAKGSGVAGAYESEFVANLYSGHQYAYNTDIWALLRRLGNLLTVSGDLWLLPQTQMHVVTAVVLALGLVAARWSGKAEDRPFSAGGSSTAIAAGILVVCFAMAASPVLASAGGFLGYRTSVGTTAVAAIAFIFAMRTLAELLWRAIGKPPASVARAGNVAVMLVASMAFAANAYANYALMKLGTNEYAYFSGIVRQAIADKARGIVLIDPRPWRGAQDYNHWPIADQHGRAVPPFELGCFSSYCRLTGGIVRVIARDLGVSDKSFDLLVTRGDDPVPGLTCEMLNSSTPSYPANASKQAIAIIDRYRGLTPLNCHLITMDWHALGIDLKR